MRLFRRFRKSLPPASPPPPAQIIFLHGAPSSPPNNRSRPEVRHKSEIEIEVKQQNQSSSNMSPVLRASGLNNSRTPSLTLDQTPRRRIFSNSVPTQTPSLIVHSSDQSVPTIVDQLTECQTIIKQQEQQLINAKKESEQLRLLLDERTNDLRHIKVKNEQLEQMIRNAQLDHQTLKIDAHSRMRDYERLEEENQTFQFQIEYERKKLDECLKMQNFFQIELENCREQHQKEINEILQERHFLTLRCDELIEENQRLEKKLAETNKQLELVTAEKDETLADMLVAVRVASELRYDAEDRLNKANEDLKRVTEHIEQERANHVQRRQQNGCGQVKIKEMIQTLEANARKNVNYQLNPNCRQRPLSQPCARVETDAIFVNGHQRTSFQPTNSSRSITHEQYDEMKSIIETVFTRMPGSVCKRDALLKWCSQRLAKYKIPVTNFSNSWTDGLAFCALLHSYLPDRINLDQMRKESKVRKRFETAFQLASSLGIVSILDVDEMCSSEWPDWERVMYYVALIFRHFEGLMSNYSSDSSSSSPYCSSFHSSNSISTVLCSPLQTV